MRARARLILREVLPTNKLISQYRHVARKNRTSRALASQFTVFLLLSLVLTSPVYANYIHPGAVPPPKPAPAPAPAPFTEKYTWTPPGGKAVPFSITVTAGESADDKADAIVAAIVKRFPVEAQVEILPTRTILKKSVRVAPSSSHWSQARPEKLTNYFRAWPIGLRVVLSRLPLAEASDRGHSRRWHTCGYLRRRVRVRWPAGSSRVCHLTLSLPPH